MSKRLLVVVASALVAIGASAQTAPTVQERLAKRRAQVELLRADADLQKAQVEVAGASSVGLPYVQAVMGLDGAMSARLEHLNGVVANYKIGEAVRPGIVVTAIAPREVWVSVGAGRGARAVPLEFKSNQDLQAAGGGGPGLPGGRPAVPAELLPPPPDVQLPPTAASPKARVPAPTPTAAAPAVAQQH
jgi:hypothetical protein